MTAQKRGKKGSEKRVHLFQKPTEEDSSSEKVEPWPRERGREKREPYEGEDLNALFREHWARERTCEEKEKKKDHDLHGRLLAKGVANVIPQKGERPKISGEGGRCIL